MKSARHQAILDLIEKYPIDRQEDLLEHLRRAGFDVTQATVSRDIRELRLVKTATGEGGYRYMPSRNFFAERISFSVLARYSVRRSAILLKLSAT